MPEAEHPLFREEDGATALRPDLIRLMGFAPPEEVETERGPERCCAAASAVWNGRHGYVAVLIRSLDPSRVRRFVYKEKISSEVSLIEAMGQAAHFAGTLGLALAREDFARLDEERRAQRIGLWNEIRKPTREPRFDQGLASDASGSVRRSLGSSQGGSSGSGKPASGEEEPPAVLGRLEVLRVDASEGTGLSPLGRVLSYF